MAVTKGALARSVGSRGARTTAEPATPAPAPEADAERPVKFTAVLEQADVTRFERVTDSMRQPVGRLAAGRYPSRADVLRALVALVDDDPDLAERVAERIKADLTARAAR